jgi:hypothetical protein
MVQGAHSDALFHDDSAAHHSHYEASIDNLCLHWFSEGVSFGRRLQGDEHDERLSRYKTRIRAQATRYEEEVLLRKRYREEMEFLQSEVFALKDQLLAVHTAYEELALNITSAPERRGFMNEDVFGSAPLDEEDFYASQQMQFMEHDIVPDQLVDDADQSRFKNHVSCIFVRV